LNSQEGLFFIVRLSINLCCLSKKKPGCQARFFLHKELIYDLLIHT